MNIELTNNKQTNGNKVDSPLSWIIASLGQVAHFTSVVIRKDNKVDSPLTTHNSLVKAIAFTLAETLVVMGIIGVVAALTIPNLNQSTGDREKVAKVKKIYSNLEDAIGRATAVYGPYNEWYKSDYNEGIPDLKAMNTRFTNRITEFMKISKDCGDKGSGCFASDYKLLNNINTDSPMALQNSHMVLLADGTAVAFIAAGVIKVDIDGVKGANVSGKDLFSFEVNFDDNSIIPDGRLSNDTLVANCFKFGLKCAAWVIETGNMDYLKVDAEGKCPNGKELNWENTSCK